jgi:hypothetical protein
LAHTGVGAADEEDDAAVVTTDVEIAAALVGGAVSMLAGVIAGADVDDEVESSPAHAASNANDENNMVARPRNPLIRARPMQH